MYVAISGIIFYAYGVSTSSENIFVASLRTIQAIFMAFGGKDSYSLVGSSPLFSNIIVQIMYWAMHVAASYLVTNALIQTFGKKLLKQIRWILNKKGELYIIYGVNSEFVSLGEEIRNKHKGCSIIFVDKKLDANLIKV